MFTGIIQHVGVVLDVGVTPAGKRFRISAGPLLARLSPGTSVAVDGACLTVAALGGDWAEFDAVPETLGRSTLKGLARSAKVNLESAVTIDRALDGHIVQGHVDGIARVTGVDRRDKAFLLRLTAPAELTDQMVLKGSVALAGVSLTIAELARESFAVAIIPTTLAATTLQSAAVGVEMNVETDLIGKYVRRYLQGLTSTPSGGLTIQKLREMGF